MEFSYTIQSYRTILSELLFIFGTSTNTNARTNIGQLANCFVGVTPDNIEGIFDCYKEQALISKGGGGNIVTGKQIGRAHV